MSETAPFKFITNNAFYGMSELRITDGANTEQTAEYATRLNITGGARHLYQTQTGTGTRRFVYINKTNKLSADTVIITDAASHLTHALTVHSWTAYTGTLDTPIFDTTNFADTLVGPSSEDWVYSFTARTNKEALGLELASGTGGAYTKTLGKLCFGTAVPFSYPVSMERFPVEQKLAIFNQYYWVRERYMFTFQSASQTEIEDLFTLPKFTEEPLFLYDSTGNWIPNKLIYGLIPQAPTMQQFDDLYQFQVEFYQLRIW